MIYNFPVILLLLWLCYVKCYKRFELFVEKYNERQVGTRGRRALRVLLSGQPSSTLRLIFRASMKRYRCSTRENECLFLGFRFIDDSVFKQQQLSVLQMKGPPFCSDYYQH
jgi:hypothetical protein